MTIPAKIEVKRCVFCGQNHILSVVKNGASDNIVKCPNTGEVISYEAYEEE